MHDTPRSFPAAPVDEDLAREDLDALLVDENADAAISSSEARLIVAALRETGRPDLAERLEPILERCTRTDRPPPP